MSVLGEDEKTLSLESLFLLDGLAEDEPLVEVEDPGNDELRGRELQVSQREGMAHEHNRAVGRMVKALKQEDGITRVIGKGREGSPCHHSRLEQGPASGVGQ